MPNIQEFQTPTINNDNIRVLIPDVNLDGSTITLRNPPTILTHRHQCHLHCLHTILQALHQCSQYDYNPINDIHFIVDIGVHDILQTERR